MSVLIFLIVLYILTGITMMKPFEKAGIPGWKALVPGVAAIEWCKLIGRKPSYAAWLLFPIVNFFIFVGMAIDLVRSFGKHGYWDTLVAGLYAPIAFFRIGSDTNAKYEGPILDKETEYFTKLAEANEKKDVLTLKKLENNNPFKKSQLREWAEAITFAVFAAAFIRMFLIEAYVIPTSSMEGSLLVGDYLFVSKAHYGMRTPKTVVQFPLVHNRFANGTRGLLDRESYFESPSLPYFRLPKLETLDRNDPVVFNFPAGDSVYITPERVFDAFQWNENLRANTQQYGKRELVTRPVDKRDHYIKRCIGIPGDSIYIKDRQVFINGAAAQNPTHAQYMYQVLVNGKTPPNPKKIDELGVNITDCGPSAAQSGVYTLDNKQVEKIKSWGNGITVELLPQRALGAHLFPHDAKRYGSWTVDNFGPLYIPKKGATTPLTADNIAFYRRIIGVYEENKLEEKNGIFYINGQEATSYTFKQDYYWCMGDNRHNSEDSRVWGFVPEDHIVGKPLFIWFSTKNANFRDGIRWNRIFSSASKL
jgi:signal peptidase I